MTRPEIIPSTQISDGSVYVPSEQSPVPSIEGETRPTVSRSLAFLNRPSFMSSSDGLTPGLTSSSSCYRDQDRTGFSIPSTPVFYPDALESSPGLHPTSDLNPFQSSPAGSRWSARQSARIRRGSSSNKGSIHQASWTGKGTLYDVLTEPGQGKTLVACSVVKTTDFAPRRKPVMRESSSHNIAVSEATLDENDGLAALAMKEADEAEGSQDEENYAESHKTSTGWGLMLEIKLRSLGRPVSLEQTAKLRTVVFGEKPRPAAYRRVESAAARKAQDTGRDARPTKSVVETRRTRIKADRIDIKANLARKTPSQMADVVPASTPVHGTSLGLSSLGLDSSDPVVVRDHIADTGPNASGPSHQRYPASLSASSSLKRKSLTIPHDQIPKGRLGPSLAGDRKKRKTDEEDGQRRRMVPLIKQETAQSNLTYGYNSALLGESIARTINAEKRPSLLEAIASSAVICKAEPPSPDPIRAPVLPRSVTYPNKTARRTPGRGIGVVMSEPAIPQILALPVDATASSHRSRPSMKRTLSEIAERESQRHAAQHHSVVAHELADDMVQSVPGLADSRRAMSQGQIQSWPPINHMGWSIDGSAVTWPMMTPAPEQPSLASTSLAAALPLSDDSASVKTLHLDPKETSSPLTEQWLQAPGLDHLFSLDATHDHTQSDPWAFEPAAHPDASFNLGVPFVDEAFSFFDSTYKNRFDPAFALSPVDFSQLPPSSPPQSSPPQSDVELQHSILLLSSPEDSAMGDTPIEGI